MVAIVRKSEAGDKDKNWNNETEDKYFEELFRISKSQIIWGEQFNFTNKEYSSYGTNNK